MPFARKIRRPDQRLQFIQGNTRNPSSVSASAGEDWQATAPQLSMLCSVSDTRRESLRMSLSPATIVADHRPRRAVEHPTQPQGRYAPITSRLPLPAATEARPSIPGCVRAPLPLSACGNARHVCNAIESAVCASGSSGVSVVKAIAAANRMVRLPGVAQRPYQPMMCLHMVRVSRDCGAKCLAASAAEPDASRSSPCVENARQRRVVQSRILG